MATIGKLIASGRDSDIFECGPGLVLRRARTGRSMAGEARTMEHVRAQGYPVPAIDQISDDGTDLVMERIEGHSMVDAAGRRPWQVRRLGRTLADLHRQLHELPAPDWLPAAPVGTGDRILHLDLHPLNVMIGPRGPMVIDWPNAARGDPSVDVALTWALVAGGEVPSGAVMGKVLGVARGQLLSSFLAPLDRAAATAQLADVVDWKVADKNLGEHECAAMKRLAETETNR